MADEALIGLDEAFAKARGQVRRKPMPLSPDVSRHVLKDALEHDLERESHWTLGWIEGFIAIQFLWGIALFVPGAQGVRTIVRALPYLSSLVLFIFYATRRNSTSQPAGAPLLIGALTLLIANLLHSTTQFSSGLAQCLFQFCIAAPMFWASKATRNARHLSTLLAVILILNFASAGLGILQVYYPERFLPPQFSRNFTADWLSTMNYVAADGSVVTRPPGLTDTPGAAAVAGGIAAILGLGFCIGQRHPWKKAAASAMSAIGLAVIYFAQTRSVLLMVIGAMVVLAVLTLRQGRVKNTGVLLAVGGALVVGAFLWASSVGGASVEQRFTGLHKEGALETYRQNRGQFLSYTVGELLDLYPFGAGVGRWGMMNAYFGDQGALDAPPIYVEIQLTGWLLDGGILMWILYGGAILVSILATIRLASSHGGPFQDVAVLIAAIQVFLAGMSMAGPTFNTQLGILFWTLTAALHGAATAGARSEVR